MTACIDTELRSWAKDGSWHLLFGGPTKRWAGSWHAFAHPRNRPGLQLRHAPSSFATTIQVSVPPRWKAMVTQRAFFVRRDLHFGSAGRIGLSKQLLVDRGTPGEPAHGL